MPENNWETIEQLAVQWIKEAGEEIKKSFTEKISVDYKSNPDDLVTNMDKKIEQFFISRIQERFPGHRILGEEGFGDSISSLNGTIWIVDPIDGTMNFVHQQCNFAISVGVYHDGIGELGLIYDVVGGELFHCRKGEGAYVNGRPLETLKNTPLEKSIIALNTTWITKNRRIDPAIFTPLVEDIRGVRSYGSAAIELAYVAAGRLDGYISMRLSPWDFAAGLVLLEEVGGVCTTVDGRQVDLVKQNSIFAAKPELHTTILTDYVQKGIDNDLYIKLERK
jgi:myo-inositol-1(or 4)-monophosphatase